VFWRVPKHCHEIETSVDSKITTVYPLENMCDAPTYIHRTRYIGDSRFFVCVFFQQWYESFLRFSGLYPRPHVWYGGRGLL